MKVDVENLWKEMEEKQDLIFYTKEGLPIKIKKRNEHCFDVYRGDKKLIPIKKIDMEFVINNPKEKSNVYQKKMYCASYAFAVYSKLCEKK